MIVVPTKNYQECPLQQFSPYQLLNMNQLNVNVCTIVVTDRISKYCHNRSRIEQGRKKQESKNTFSCL